MTLKKGFSSRFATGIGCLGNDRNRMVFFSKDLFLSSCFHKWQCVSNNRERSDKNEKQLVHSIWKPESELVEKSFIWKYQQPKVRYFGRIYYKRKPFKWFHSGIRYYSPISSIEFLDCNNMYGNYTMCRVQQEHQTGVHSMIGDRTYRSVLVSYIILRVIRNSFISRVRSCLMLLLNTTHRVVAVHIVAIKEYDK